VGEADVIAGGFEKTGVAFDVVPRIGLVAVPAVMELGAGTVAEEVTAGNEGGPAGAAGGGGDEDVGAQDPFFRNPFKGGGGDDIVGGRMLRIGVGGCVASQIVGEEEEDIGTAFGRRKSDGFYLLPGSRSLISCRHNP
jgi:hypothetical protein